MASKIEIVIQNAIRTFSKHFMKIAECSPSELNELRSLTDELTHKDFNKFGCVLKSGDLKEFFRKKKSEIDYLSVYEDEIVSIGVFLLRQGAKLPIHDHPNMYGIIKVLEGIFKITSYSVLELDKSTVTSDKAMFYNHPLKVTKHPEILVSSKDQSCLLTPTERNIHEVECVEGPAAFLDILSPRYEDGDSNLPRVCHYFQEVRQPTTDESQDDCMRLIQVQGLVNY